MAAFDVIRDFRDFAKQKITPWGDGVTPSDFPQDLFINGNVMAFIKRSCWRRLKGWAWV